MKNQYFYSHFFFFFSRLRLYAFRTRIIVYYLPDPWCFWDAIGFYPLFQYLLILSVKDLRKTEGRMRIRESEEWKIERHWERKKKHKRKPTESNKWTYARKGLGNGWEARKKKTSKDNERRKRTEELKGIQNGDALKFFLEIKRKRKKNALENNCAFLYIFSFWLWNSSIFI